MCGYKLSILSTNIVSNNWPHYLQTNKSNTNKYKFFTAFITGIFMISFLIL
jgi:hypothetical protein